MKEKDIYIVLRNGYYTIASKATTNKALADKYCKRLCKEAGNKNSYYVETISLVEE